MRVSRRVFLAFTLLGIIYFFGSIGFYTLSDTHTFGECLFGTFILLSTVDRPFPEDEPFTQSLGYKLLCAIVLIGGVGTFLYAVGSITTILVEGIFTDVFRRRKMQNRIDRMRNHIVVCGAGKTGVHIIDELVKLQIPFVVVDNDEERLKALQEKYKDVHYITGDATQDEVLQSAGVERAKGVVTALPTDRDNLFVVITARQLNPRARIVTKAVDPHTERKLRKAGADSVVTTTLISGLRMVSEMVRPKTTLFLDKMLRDPFQTTRIDEVHIGAGSALHNKTLEEARLSKTAGVLVLAIKRADEEHFVFRPSPDEVLNEGAVLIVLGTVSDIQKARRLAAHSKETAD